MNKKENEIKKLYEIREKNLHCISVGYVGKNKFYAFNGSRDRRKVLKEIIEDILKLDGANPKQCYFDGSVSIFPTYPGLNYYEIDKNARVIHEDPGKQSCDELYDVTTPYEWRYSVKKKAQIDKKQNRLFTCSERKVIGGYLNNPQVCSEGWESFSALEKAREQLDAMKIISTKEPCVLCEPFIKKGLYYDGEKIVEERTYLSEEPFISYFVKRTYHKI